MPGYDSWLAWALGRAKGDSIRFEKVDAVSASRVSERPND